MIPIVSPGDLLADRFLIVRFIAEGGMGEVYEAEDQVLQERVALKLLSRRAFGDELVQRRFRREIQLARKVTHANVCRIFDVFQHRPEGGLLAGEAVSFVTMELLRGETLEDYLKRRGPLAEDEALPLIRQMAEGLAAAHAAGVVHRDFKTNNVLLVPGAEEEVRAVITDFGLARPIAAAEESSHTPLTGEAHLVGTAHYIAPEQLYGDEVTPQSDVYAFGVVMFEMVTGHKPYSATNPMMLLAKRASQPPASPRDFVPGLDEVWETAILRCLESSPENRPQTPREAVAPLLEAAGWVSDSTASLPQPSGVLPRPAALPSAGEQSSPSGVRPSGIPAPAGKTRRSLAWMASLLLLSVLLAAAWLLPRSVLWREESFRSFNPVQVTTSAGLELDPTFSPDGTALAYSSDKSGSFEIWLKDLTPGGRERQLTEGDEQLFEPAWSPDGETIAYHSKTRAGIWVKPVAGGPAVQLTEFGSRPAWSPDGSRLVFQSESSPQLSDTAAPALALSTLWTIGADRRSLQQLTLAGSPDGGHGAPSFSPDGRRIVFSTSRYGASEIWSVDLETRDVLPLVRDPETGYDPTYAPDGKSVYFSARSRQVNGLWRIPVSPKTGRPAGPPQQIANLGLASIRQLAVSRDGRRLAYATMQTMSNLWSLPLVAGTAGPGGRPSPLTTGTGRNNRPVFSPDGRRIAFDRWRLGVSIDIWTMTADGGEPTQVTVDAADCAQSSWYPEGDRLAFRTERDGRRALWAIDLESRGETRVTDLEEDVYWARLSPDGTRLAYHSRLAGGSDDLWVKDLVRGEARQLTTASYSMAFPVWSPDGEWLAFQKRQDGDSQVMVIEAAGGGAVALTSAPGQNWPYSFSPDGDKVAFAALRGGEWGLWWVSRSSGEERRLTEPPRLNQYLRYPLWSPAGDRIVYELAQTAGDIYLVEDLSGD